MGLSPRRFYFVSGRGPQPWGSLQSTPETGKQFRNFRTNSGTTDYVQLAAPEAGFESVEFTFSTSSANAQGFMLGSDGSYIRIFSGVVRSFRTGGAQLDFGGGQLADGRLHHIIVTFDGVNTIAFADGVQAAVSVGNAVPAQMDRLCTYQTGGFAGTLSDLRITSGGTLIHNWPMNEGSGSTHVDVIGGNNGTIINGQPEDWELFERLPGANFWTGTMSGRILEIA